MTKTSGLKQTLILLEMARCTLKSKFSCIFFSIKFDQKQIYQISILIKDGVFFQMLAHVYS